LTIEGFRYVPEVITADEERELVDEIAQLPFAAAMFRGFTARRRIVHFDETPGFLIPLRRQAAALGGLDESSLERTLVTEYAAGAVIGWHRDAPAYGPTVVGFSFGAACRMRFRRGHKKGEVVERWSIVLEPRSAYVMGGAARAEWQHSIPAVDALRYSVTFRTLRAQSAR
jgi:alkylated DNA repair dioxygenase AlkB